MRDRNTHFATDLLLGPRNGWGANTWPFKTDGVFDGIDSFLDRPSQDTDGCGDEERWPLAYTAAFVIVSSVCLWTAIIAGLTRLF